MLIKKDKKDRFQPNRESSLSIFYLKYIYIGSNQVDYYIHKDDYSLRFIKENNGFYYMPNDSHKQDHSEAMELCNKLKLLK